MVEMRTYCIPPEPVNGRLEPVADLLLEAALSRTVHILWDRERRWGGETDGESDKDERETDEHVAAEGSFGFCSAHAQAAYKLHASARAV